MGRRAFSRAGIARRLFNTPLAVTDSMCAIVLGVVGQRMDVGELVMLTDGTRLGLAQLEDRAAEALHNIEAKAPFDHRRPDARATDVMSVVNGVAHIDIRGELVSENGIGPASGFTGYDGIRAQVATAIADPSVKGYILDIDSPGGEVTDLFELTEFLMSVKGQKPSRAIIRGMGCSGAYALAVCCDEITLNEFGWAGSIGCVMIHADFSKKHEKEGVTATVVRSKRLKMAVNSLEPLSDEGLAKLQAAVDAVDDRFVALVSAARGLSAENIDATEADSFQGQAAVDAGLVDKVMGWADSQIEFTERVNGRQPPVQPQRRTAAAAARATQEKPMPPEATTPAANTQPDNTTVETQVATEQQASGGDQTTTEQADGTDTPAATAATGGGATTADAAASERTRVLALMDLCPESSVSASLRTAIAEGQSEGAFAIALAQNAKAKGSTMDRLRAGAVQADEVPKGGASSGTTEPKTGAERGSAIVALAASLGNKAVAHLKPNAA